MRLWDYQTEIRTIHSNSRKIFRFLAMNSLSLIFAHSAHAPAWHFLKICSSDHLLGTMPWSINASPALTAVSPWHYLIEQASSFSRPCSIHYRSCCCPFWLDFRFILRSTLSFYLYFLRHKSILQITKTNAVCIYHQFRREPFNWGSTTILFKLPLKNKGQVQGVPTVQLLYSADVLLYSAVPHLHCKGLQKPLRHWHLQTLQLANCFLSLFFQLAVLSLQYSCNFLVSFGSLDLLFQFSYQWFPFLIKFVKFVVQLLPSISSAQCLLLFDRFLLQLNGFKPLFRSIQEPVKDFPGRIYVVEVAYSFGALTDHRIPVMGFEFFLAKLPHLFAVQIIPHSCHHQHPSECLRSADLFKDFQIPQRSTGHPIIGNSV